MMKEFALTLAFDDSTPLYRQLYHHLATEIQNGHLRAGDRLPSKRQLCTHLNISMATVETAYGMLCAEGYIVSKPRSGYVVSQVVPLSGNPVESPSPQVLPEPPSRPKWDYHFSTGAVDTSQFPFSTWARITKEAVYQNPELLQQGHPQGDLPLRQALAELLRQYRGVICSPEQIIIGAGLGYLLGVVIQLLPSNASIALEDPGYTAAADIITSYGRAPVPLPMNQDGISPDTLEKSGACAAFVTPSHQFPMGITMPLSRRTQLLSWADSAPERWLLEDDYDSEFRYSSRTIPALQGLDSTGKVVYLGTFSRSIAPSIRMAYLILPAQLLERYYLRFPRAAPTVSRFEQETLRRFLTEGHYASHLRRMNNLYRRRLFQLTDALSQAFPDAIISGADAGLHFLFTLPRFSEEELCRKAAEYNVGVRGLSQYCHKNCPRSSTLVLGFAGMDEGAVNDAVKRLQKAWRK